MDKYQQDAHDLGEEGANQQCRCLADRGDYAPSFGRCAGVAGGDGMSALEIGGVSFLLSLAGFCAVDLLINHFFGAPMDFRAALRCSWGVGCGAIIGVNFVRRAA